MIEIGPHLCRDFAAAISREWLETNGLGGFASSTVSGANTRRYHGLLLAAHKGCGRRMALLNQMEEVLISKTRSWPLSSHLYASKNPARADPVIAPQGHLWLERFALAPWPVWTYRTDAWTLEKSVMMPHRQNTVLIRYRLVESTIGPVEIKARPLLTGREYHALHLENPQLNHSVKADGSRLTFEPYIGVPAIYVHHDGQFQESFYWYRGFLYPREQERGLDCVEDCWSPGFFTFKLEPGQSAFVAAGTEPQFKPEVDVILTQERTRRESLAKLPQTKITAGGIEKAPPSADPELNEAVDILARNADQFLARRDKNARTILAGYPWFTDWGRDAFISIFGLCFATGRHQAAREVIEFFAKNVKDGMIPNYLPEQGQPAYNSADASLWFVLAVYQYWRDTKDLPFVKTTAWPKCVEILRAYRQGTGFGIKLDADGLLRAGSTGTQVTWMDAAVDGQPVTPREGKPVELQALWFNALHGMSILGMALGEMALANEYLSLAKTCQTAFNRFFWNEPGGYLHDVVTDQGPDASLRPNQLFAISLPFELLNADRAPAVVAMVQNHLLTPFGLRTLSPFDPRYHGRYEGGEPERARAYHQGTVWSWLMGPFISSHLKAHHYSPEAQAQAALWLKPLLTRLREDGLGSVSEVFNGDAPHRAGGCPFQAWGTAELLRVLLQELKLTGSAV